MARVTDGDVKEILDTDIDTTAFIIAANLIVTDKLASSGLSTTHLKEIERWLAAHLACTNDKRSQSEKLGAAEATYEGKTGLGLDSTSYGQQVKLLDTTGTLARLGMKRGRVIVASRNSDSETCG